MSLNRLFWALRKAKPFVGNGLVLDVGSGGAPYPRADILVDRLSGEEHRNNLKLVIDRHTIFADAHFLPFKNNSFDFVIASHILEHMSKPALFLDEIERIGNAGYIETPNAIFERLHPYDIHCLELMLVDNKLHIRKKSSECDDFFLGNLKFLEKDFRWRSLFRNNLNLFHVQYRWRGKIDYEILNDDVSCDWIDAINQHSNSGEIAGSSKQGRSGWRRIGLTTITLYYKILRYFRLRNFNLDDILCCPKCHSEFNITLKSYDCGKCCLSFKKSENCDFTV